MSEENETTDLRGHFHGCDPTVLQGRLRMARFLTRVRDLPSELAADLARNMDAFADIGECPACGETVRIIGSDVLTVDSACPYPQGLPAYSVDIDVPSGRLAFANDLRPLFPQLEDFNVGLTSGLKRCTEAYARQGCIHVFVGNTCPSVRLLDSGTLTVGRARSPGRQVGSVCTDLWWVSAADHDLIKQRAAALKEEMPGDLFVVDVAPGTYRATIYWHLCGPHEGAAVYLAIENVSDPMHCAYPVPTGDGISFEREVLLSRIAYPSLYPNRASVLNHFFCVNGNGYEWYDGVLVGGSRRDKALQRLATGAPVTWDNNETPATFYPLCQYAKLACVPDNIRPDWLAGVREVLHLILATDPAVIGAGGWPNTHNIEFARRVAAALERRPRLAA